MIIPLCFALAICSGAPPATAAQPDARPYRVDVRVTGDDGIQSSMRNMLIRELRAVRGVVVTTDRPHYRIGVIVMPVISKSGSKLGLAYSVVVTSSPDADAVRDASDPRLLVSHWIQTGAMDDLKQVSRGIVEAFEAEALAGPRAAAASGRGIVR